MKQRGLSFKVDDGLFEYFDKRENKTGFLRDLVEMHKEHLFLVRNGAEEVKKKFTEREFLLLCDILNGYLFTERSKNVYLQIEIGDADRIYFESHGITRDELKAKVAALSVTETYFLTFAVEKFWAASELGLDGELSVEVGRVSDDFDKLAGLCHLEAERLLKEGKATPGVKIAFWTSDIPELIGTGEFSDDGAGGLQFNFSDAESTL